jgi:FMN phosphatase YigB (HAD superfamily)
MYKKIICFDFDGTLCHTPEPSQGEKIWLEKTGTVWPYKGWWGKEESLDTDIFDIPVNDWVYKKYLEAVADDSAYVILATGRIEKSVNMRNRVESILSDNNLSFDKVYLNTGGDTFKFKIKLFENLTNELGIDDILMFDDRQEHLVKFEEWAVEQTFDVTIVDVVNKETKTFQNK